MFVKNVGKANQRIIQIVVEDFDLGLVPFETDSRERAAAESRQHVRRQEDESQLPNGMPAFWIRVSQGAQIGQFTRRYEYVIVDLRRGITVSYIGRQGDFDEKEAQAALADLAVVAYPAQALARARGFERSVERVTQVVDEIGERLRFRPRGAAASR